MEANDTPMEFSRKFKSPDTKFMTDLVGDKTGSLIGPFARAQNMSHHTQVTPSCTGWFEEFNRKYV